MKIMIVDDCQTTRRLLGIYLKSRGYEPVFAENGIDALEKLASTSVNLVVTDLNMPYMDGIEFLKNLRSEPGSATLPVVMVTTEADPEERERALAAGANDYIIKPVTAEMVSKSIKHILKQLVSRGGVPYV
jgi:two-component system chemotaxis response regulator CheY